MNTEGRPAGQDLAGLSDAERAALRELSTLGVPLTHAQIGARLGLSSRHVQALEKRALEKMKKAARWSR